MEEAFVFISAAGHEAMSPFFFSTGKGSDHTVGGKSKYKPEIRLYSNESKAPPSTRQKDSNTPPGHMAPIWPFLGSTIRASGLCS